MLAPPFRERRRYYHYTTPPPARVVRFSGFGNLKIKTRKLLCFFVQSFLFVEFAEFLQFQPFGRIFLVLFGLVIQVMANRTFQIYQMILTHGNLLI
jgi:hypothetical protein